MQKYAATIDELKQYELKHCEYELQTLRYNHL